MAMQIVQREEHCKRTWNSKWKPRNSKISLEDYLNLLDSRNYSDLSVHFLHQIITMHGYKKIYKTSKVVIAEAVSRIEFLNPSRSTLNEEISSSVSPALEIIVSDLDALNWQECSITSVQSLNSSIHLAISSFSAPLEPKNHSSDSSEHNKTKPKSIATRKNVISLCASNGDKQKGQGQRAKRTMKRKKSDSDGCVLFGSS